MSEKAHHLLIDGDLVPAAEGQTFAVENPATETIAGTAPDAGLADMDRAVAAARRAADEGPWGLDAGLRREALERLEKVLRARVDEYRPYLVTECGMPVSFARMLGVDAAIGYIPRFLATYDGLTHQREIPPASIFGRSVLRRAVREPVGVVVAITPWNVPFELNLRKAVQALVAGNTVVLKPAPQTPWSGTLLAEAVAEAGLPRGVFNIVTTADNSVAHRLVEHPLVDQVSFTGSTATGSAIMASAAKTIKRVGLELGGKSASILLDPLGGFEAAVRTAAGGVCTMAGQGCTLITRLIVPRKRMVEAAEIAAATVGAVRLGDPADPETMMGPLISHAQRQRVLGYMEIGRSEATLVAGGGKPAGFERGYYVEPTVFTDVPPDARIAREEIFGPVLSIIGYDDEDEAIRIANATDYGLAGSVIGDDLDRALTVAARIKAGVVSVNGAPWFDPDSVFGGYRQSGIGREFGPEGIEEFMEIKLIALPA